MAERLRALVGTSTSIAGPVAAARAAAAPADSRPVARGVYLVAVDPDGTIEVQGVLDCDDPTFVVLHPRLPLAYAVNELPGTAGQLSVLSLSAGVAGGATGSGAAGMARVAHVPLAGEAPCHLALTPDARGLLVVHYGCATVQWLGLDVQGLPDGRSSTVRHAGRGVHPRRQASAHAHCVLPLGNDVYVTDLGLDAVFHYRLQVHAGAQGDATDVPLELVLHARCTLAPGAGPRHLCADRRGEWVYVCNELSNSISCLRRSADGTLVDTADASLPDRRPVSTLPADFDGRSATGEITLHPDGRWLYVSNRGHDSIAWFDVVTDGPPEARGWTASGGVHPRHFAIAPDGQHLLVANRDSDTLQLFALDRASGALRAVGAPTREVPSPVCVCFLQQGVGLSSR